MDRSADVIAFLHLVASASVDDIARRVAANPALATAAAGTGATREVSVPFFLATVSHYVYAGDTALHIAAAAFRRNVAAMLIERGARCQARNRRGAQPLHYAADANRVDGVAQAQTIEYLIAAGADPNAVDRSGVSPLHRAVRTRSAAAVRALLDGGADSRRPNKAGSMPLHLAVQTTGRGGSGSSQARDEQAAIIRLLIERGAKSSDTDGRGKDAFEAASSEWAKALLR